MTVLAALLVLVTQVGERQVEAATGSVVGLVQLQEEGATGAFAGVTMTLTAGASPGGALVESTSTSVDGLYSLSAEEGTYTLTAEPPDASGLTPSSRTVTVTAAGTTTENFLFAIVETKLTVSGTITGPGDLPIAGASVEFIGPEPTDGGSDTTDATGAYSIEVLPRSFGLVVDVSNIAPFPDRYSLFATAVPITADTPLDIRVPGSTVTIEVVDDTTGDPITALVTAGSRQSGPSILGQASTVNSVLEEVTVAGSIEVVLAPGGTASASATATDYFGATEDFELPATSTATLRLVPEPDPDQTRITGRVLDPDGNPVAGAQVLVRGSEPQPGTDSNGEFDVVADAPLGGGNSVVEIRSPFPAPATSLLPPRWAMRSVDVPHPEGGRTDIGDIELVPEDVTVNVVDPDGVPVPAAYFDASDSPWFPPSPAPFGPYAGQFQTRYDSDVTSDSSGTMLLKLADNSGATGFLDRYEMYFDPPLGVDTCTFSAYNLVSTPWEFDVVGPTTVTVEMRADRDNPRCDGGPVVPETTVTGTLLLDGTAVDRTFVGFLTPGPDGGRDIRVGSETDPSGVFTADIIDGDHRMDVFRTFPTDVWPRLRLVSDEPVVTTENATEPGPIELGTFDVPLDDLEVTVLTPDGRPIPGVKVSTPVFPSVSFQMNGFGFSGTSNFPGSPSTDSNGEATLPLLPGTYDLLFTPEAGFVAFRLDDVVLPEGGAGVQVQLAYPHAPPTAVITPTGTSTGVDTFEGTVTVGVEPEAFAGFAVESVSVSVDGGTPFDYTGPFPVTALGEHTVVVQVTDDGSVTGPPVSRDFTIVETTVPPTDDPVPPTDDPVPPTDDPVPPTDDPVPPTDDPVPPTDDPVPPTDAPNTGDDQTPAEPVLPATDPVPPADVVEPVTELPETGSEVTLTLFALLLLLGGSFLVTIARRPRTA